MTIFGPEYPKIQTLFKRDERGVIIPGDYSTPELAYLADKQWRWTEKVDGTNIRLHWNGSEVTMGGKTDRAQLPQELVATLQAQGIFDPERWGMFDDDAEVTVYGEGYGPKIQSGGMYRQDQAFIVFDVRVGNWWLNEEDVVEIAEGLGLAVVPYWGDVSLVDAWASVVGDALTSAWYGARIEGLVGRPAVPLFDRRGNRIMTKVKVKDWTDYQRRNASS